MSQIVTGDAVLLDLRPARIPTRILADLVDIGVILLLGWGWTTLTTAMGGSVAAQQAVALVGYIVISFGYLIGFETLTRGRTPGAYVVGLQAVRDDGGTIRFRHALLRGLAFWLVDYSLYTGFLMGTIVSIVNPSGKRIGDVLAGTMVIRVRAPLATGTLPDMPAHLAEWASTLEMSRVTDEQFAAARMALQRDRLMRRGVRADLLGRLAHQVSLRTAPPPPALVPPEDFLAAVCAENRRRAGLRVMASQAVPTAGELPTGWR